MPGRKRSRMATPVADSRMVASHSRSRSPADSSMTTPRWPPESAGLSTAGSPTSASASRAASQRLDRGPRRLRHAGLGEGAPHQRLVRHALGRRRADAGQPERLGDGGDHRHGAIGRDRQHAVDPVPLGGGDHALDVLEVDRLGDVGLLQPERVGVAVDADHAQAELARALDRAALVPSRADEEHAAHGAER